MSASAAAMAKLPQLSNEAQLKIMNLVKGGLSLDEALKKAEELAKFEKDERDRAVRAAAKAQRRGVGGREGEGEGEREGERDCCCCSLCVLLSLLSFPPSLSLAAVPRLFPPEGRRTASSHLPPLEAATFRKRRNCYCFFFGFMSLPSLFSCSLSPSRLTFSPFLRRPRPLFPPSSPPPRRCCAKRSAEQQRKQKVRRRAHCDTPPSSLDADAGRHVARSHLG